MPRNASMDLLRIISAICIVLIHVTPAYKAFGDIYPLFIQPAVRPGLPIFFMISGYFALNSKCESTLTFYRNRLVSIIIPFIVFSFIHYTFFHQWDSDAYSEEWLVNYIKSVFYGAPINFELIYFKSAIFWYVYLVIGLYLISPALKNCLSFANSTNSCRLTFVIVSSYMLYLSLEALLAKNGFSSNILSMPTNIKWIFYFVVGGLIYRIPKQFNNRYLISCMTIAYLLVMVTCYGSSSNEWYSYDWIDGNACMAFLSISIFMLFHNNQISNSPAICYLSSLTYGVYLVQIMMISIVDWYSGYLGQGTIGYVITTSIFVVIFSAIAASALNEVLVNRLVRYFKR